MNQWYYSINGKAQGPVTSEFVIENLRKGQMTLVDLVFRAGDAGWVTVGEISEFRAAYNALPLQVPPGQVPAPPTQFTIDADEISASNFESATAGRSDAHVVNTPNEQPFEIGAFKKMISLSDSSTVQPLTRPQSGWPRDWQLSTSWIVLKRRVDGNGFDQDGPYSAEQIIEMIGQGKVEYAQYCWKPGYTRWFRIGNLPEFDRRKRDRDNDTVNQIVAVPEIREALPALTREDLLAGVERLRQQARKTAESAPAGTDGRDLARNAIDVTPVAVKNSAPTSVSASAAQPRIESKAPTPAPAEPTGELKAWRPQVRAGDTEATSANPVGKPATVAMTAEMPEPESWSPTSIGEAGSAKVSAQPPTSEVPSWSVPQVQRPQTPAGKAFGAFSQSEISQSATVPEAATPAPKRGMRLGVAAGIAGVVVLGLVHLASIKSDPVAPAARKPAAKPQENPVHREQDAPVRNENEMPENVPENVPTNMPADVPGDIPDVLPSERPAGAQQNQVSPSGNGVAKTLEILPMKLASKPALTFQTDAGVGQTIAVTVSAKTGEVLRFGSYTNSFQVTRSSGEVPTLDLSKLDLPSGNYKVAATVGAATTSKQIFIGVKSPEFSAQLERHIKGLSYRQQAERKSMFYGATKLAQLAESLGEKSQSLKGQPKAWRKELLNWRAAAKDAAMPVLQFAASPRNESAYPDQLAAFQAAAERLAAQANEIDAAMEQKREIASSGLDGVAATLAQLRNETAVLSGRPQASN